MTPDTAVALMTLGWILVAVGLVGSIVPVLPGPSIIWLGAMVWAWGDGFEHIGWPRLALLGGMALVAAAADFMLSSWGARMGGATWRGVVAATVGAFVGLIVFSIPGAIIGAAIGLVAVEAAGGNGLGRPGLNRAWRSGRGMLLGWIVGIAVQATIGILMALIFASAALGSADAISSSFGPALVGR